MTEPSITPAAAADQVRKLRGLQQRQSAVATEAVRAEEQLKQARAAEETARAALVEAMGGRPVEDAEVVMAEKSAEVERLTASAEALITEAERILRSGGSAG